MNLEHATLKINEKYLALVPRPTKEERQRLKESIILHGQREPIIVNQNHTILDGHTRYEICQELGIEAKYVVKHFDGGGAERFYVIDANLSRRHLTAFQKFELVHALYKMEKRHSSSDTAALFSRQLGMGRSYFFKCQWLVRNAPPDVIERLHNGTTSAETEYVRLHRPGVTPVGRLNSSSEVCCPLCNGKFKRGDLRVVRR